VARAFTLIELLTVIAIIAVLAAIIFPVFAAAREQARQSTTMSNMHAVYVGARTFFEDEKQWPQTLFPYAETQAPLVSGEPANCPLTRPAAVGNGFSDVNASGDVVVPMDKATGTFTMDPACSTLNYGYTYGEQIKDYQLYLCPDNLTTDKQAAVAPVYPLNIPSLGDNNLTGTVTWRQDTSTASSNNDGTDPDLPTLYSTNSAETSPYVGLPKFYYKMDSMDVGPRIDANGDVVKDSNGNTIYELHYSPDWTKELGATFDVLNGQAIVNQLKYQNPPEDRTLITWVNDHVVTAHSNSVIILLGTGTAKKITPLTASQQLPLYFQP
jgi:prepilin-type N-terminal cleavage/methylation domain-containing protein